MKYTQLKDDIALGARSVYLLEGDDAYFRAKAEEQIKSAFLEMPELNFTAFEGAQCKGEALTDLTSALAAFPFMAPKRIVKVSEFYPTEGDFKRYLQDFLEQFPSDSILIIVNSKGGKGVDLKRRKAVTYIDCNRADEEAVAKWAYVTLKRAGVSSTVEACEAIASYCVRDMARVSMEVEKLIEWGKGGSITKADVDNLVYKDAEYRIYEMTKAVARRDYTSFTLICNDLLSKGYDENALLSSLLNYFKNLLAILTQSKSDSALAAELKMSEWAVGKNREEARRMGEERLCSLVRALYSLISSFRGGLITKDGALESAVCNVLFG